MHSILVAAILATASLADTVAPSMTTEPAQFFKQQNSQRVKIRYGPFTTDGMDTNNGMTVFEKVNIQKPCNDCLITWIQAGLEYGNGTSANANTNYWLHHTVFANLNRTSTVCPIQGYPDLFFASGNERTAANICVNGTNQAGYYLASSDVLAMSAELMNMAMSPQTAYVTMTFEYIPNPPSTFSPVKALWFDIGGCLGGSDQPVKSTTAPFQYTSPKWVSDISGKVTFAGAHLHDGGTHLEIQKNGTDQCNAVATYGASPAYVGGGMPMSMTMSMTTSSMDMSSMTMSMPSSTTGMAMPASTMLMDNVHISNISTCTDDGVVSPGDVWTITAYYDPTKHDLMTYTNGTATPIMGISLMYVADLNLTETSGSGTATSSSSPSGSSSGAGGGSATSSASPTASSSGADRVGWAKGMMTYLGIALGWMFM